MTLKANKFTDLPSNLDKLIELCSFNESHNKFKTFPIVLNKIRNLSKLIYMEIYLQKYLPVNYYL